MVYSIREISDMIRPIAEEYGLRAVWLFGSYARASANEQSDIDILIDREGSRIRGMFDMGGLYNALSRNMEKEIDLVTLQMLDSQQAKERTPEFVSNVRADMVKIYG